MMLTVLVLTSGYDRRTRIEGLLGRLGPKYNVVLVLDEDAAVVALKQVAAVPFLYNVHFCDKHVLVLEKCI